ncbi:hypothetical protein J3B02_006164, partial [Coemansia erecta]
ALVDEPASASASSPASSDSANVLDVVPLDKTALVSEDLAKPTSSALSNAAATVVEPQQSLTQDAPSPKETANYVPLFDFNLAPYNVALEIVAEALEKLADTMEPIDLPLPLVGPGYYLEVMVKAPKNPRLPPPPFGQANPISIEGGQAPPVTEIDIILPGESEIHQTIMLSAEEGQSPSSASQEESSSAEPEPLASGISAPVPVVEPETAVAEETETEPESEAITMPLSNDSDASASPSLFPSSLSESDAVIDTLVSIVGPVVAGTESVETPLSETPTSSESSIGNSEQVIVGQFSNSGVFEGHLT